MKSFWAICALVVGLLVLGGYGYATTRGLILGSPTGRFIPKEARAHPKGYRSFHYWRAGSGGYRGGK